ncbi:hypothetical protein HZA97_00065 [Candidatus Woesearchaeota archaeon]|nr:hypothetical protein [Candidatus Woesearchaeota archaeon]
MVFLVSFIGGTGYYYVTYVDKVFTHVDSGSRGVLLLEEIKSDFSLQFQELTDYIKNKNPENLNNYINTKEEIKNKIKEIELIVKEIQSIEKVDNVLASEEGIRTLNSIKEELDKLDRTSLEIMRLTKMNDGRSALDKLVSELNPQLSRVKLLIEHFTELGKKSLMEERMESRKQVQLAENILLTSTIVTVIFALILGLVLSKKVTERIVEEVNKLAGSIERALASFRMVEKLNVKKRKKEKK